MINASASFGQTIPSLRLRNHRLPLRTLRLRSKEVNMAKAEKAPPAERRLRRAAPASTSGGEMPALMHDLADRVGAIFTEQFRRAGYDAKTAPIYAHALVGMVAFVGQWWTESRKPPPVEAVAAHIAALAWMGLRHLPKRPTLLATTGGRS